MRKWAAVEPLIEESRPRGKTEHHDLRRMIEAILWRNQNAAKWHSIPAEHNVTCVRHMAALAAATVNRRRIGPPIGAQKGPLWPNGSWPDAAQPSNWRSRIGPTGQTGCCLRAAAGVGARTGDGPAPVLSHKIGWLPSGCAITFRNDKDQPRDFSQPMPPSSTPSTSRATSSHGRHFANFEAER